MKYWWANHTEHSRSEIRGGYLWKARSVKALSRAQPGDTIVSYAATLVTHVGIVTDYATGTPNPALANDGSLLGAMGWLLPVQWHRLQYPVRPKSHIAELTSHLSMRSQPLNPDSGSSNPAVQFTRISAGLYDAIVSHSGEIGDAETALPLSLLSVRERLENSIEWQIKNDATLEATVKVQAILARRGQGEFRRAVAALEPRCRLTSVDNPSFLVASHIMPWRSCETAAERLDGNNGLFLAPHVDWLFDRGLLTFSDAGCPLTSELLPTKDLDNLGLSDLVRKSTPAFSAAQASYLSYHRDNVFLK